MHFKQFLKRKNLNLCQADGRILDGNMYWMIQNKPSFSQIQTELIVTDGNMKTCHLKKNFATDKID